MAPVSESGFVLGTCGWSVDGLIEGFHLAAPPWTCGMAAWRPNSNKKETFRLARPQRGEDAHHDASSGAVGAPFLCTGAACIGLWQLQMSSTAPIQAFRTMQSNRSGCIQGSSTNFSGGPRGNAGGTGEIRGSREHRTLNFVGETTDGAGPLLAKATDELQARTMAAAHSKNG